VLGKLIFLFIAVPLADLTLLIVMSSYTGWALLFAAGMLLTPGFLTDAFGLSVLIPQTRRWYRSILAKWLKESVNFRYVQMPMQSGGNTVDGDVVKQSDPTDTEEPRRIKSGELLP